MKNNSKKIENYPWNTCNNSCKKRKKEEKDRQENERKAKETAENKTNFYATCCNNCPTYSKQITSKCQKKYNSSDGDVNSNTGLNGTKQSNCNDNYDTCASDWDTNFKKDTITLGTTNKEILKNKTFTISSTLTSQLTDIINEAQQNITEINNNNTTDFVDDNTNNKNTINSLLQYFNNYKYTAEQIKNLWDSYLILLNKDVGTITNNDIMNLNNIKNNINSKINLLEMNSTNGLMALKNNIYLEIDTEENIKQINNTIDGDNFINYNKINIQRKGSNTNTNTNSNNIEHFDGNLSVNRNKFLVQDTNIDTLVSNPNSNRETFKRTIDEYAGDLYLDRNQILDNKVESVDIPYNVRKNAYDNNYIYTLNKCNEKYNIIDENDDYSKKINQANIINENINVSNLNKHPNDIQKSIKLTEDLYWATNTNTWQAMENSSFASNCNKIIDGKVIKDNILETDLKNPMEDSAKLELLRKKIYYGRENIYKGMVGKDIEYNLGETKVMCPKVENEDINVLEWVASPPNLQYDMCINKSNPQNLKNYWRGEALSKKINGTMEMNNNDNNNNDTNNENSRDYWLENVENLNTNRKIYKDILENPTMKGYDKKINKNLSSWHSDLLRLSGNSIQKSLQDRDWYKSTENWNKMDILRENNMKKYFIEIYLPLLENKNEKLNLNLNPIQIKFKNIVNSDNLILIEDTLKNSIFKNNSVINTENSIIENNNLYSNIEVISNNGEGVIRLYSNGYEYNDYLINYTLTPKNIYIGKNTGNESIVIKNQYIDDILMKPVFTFQINLTITSNYGGWRNIFHYGNNNGERMPAMWIFPNNPWRIHFRIRTNRSWNDGFNFDIPSEFREYNKELDINIKISGKKKINNASKISFVGDENITIIIYINGILAGQRVWDNNSYIDLLAGRKMYIKDPWHGRNNYTVNSFIISEKSAMSNLLPLNTNIKTNIIAMVYNNLYWDLNELTTNGQDLYIVCSNTQNNNDIYNPTNGFMCLYEDAQINQCYYTKKTENSDLQIKWSIYNLENENDTYLLYHKESKKYLAFGKNYDIISKLSLPTFNIMETTNIIYDDKKKIEIRNPLLYFISQSDLKLLYEKDKRNYAIISQEIKWNIIKNNNANKYEIKTANTEFNGMNLWFSSNTSQFRKLNETKTEYIYGKTIGSISCIDLNDPNNSYFCDNINNISCYNKYFYIVPTEPEDVSNNFNLRNNTINNNGNVDVWYKHLFSECTKKKTLNNDNKWYRTIDKNFQVPYSDMPLINNDNNDDVDDDTNNNTSIETIQINPYKNLYSSIKSNEDDIFSTYDDGGGYKCSSSSYCNVEKEKRNTNNIQPIQVSYKNENNRVNTVSFNQPINNYKYNCVKKKYGIYKIYNNKINIEFNDIINENILTKEDDVYYNNPSKKIGFNIFSQNNIYTEGKDYGMSINGTYIWFKNDINISIISFYEIEMKLLNNLFIHLENIDMEISQKRKKKQLLYEYDKLKYINAGFYKIDATKVYSYNNYNSNITQELFIPSTISI